MPATVSGNPANFKPDVDIGFRFDDAAFMVLSLDEKNAQVDSSARRIAEYFKFLDPEDSPPPDIFLPDMRDIALQTSIAYNRDYGALDPYFTIMVRFVDEVGQTGIPPGQVKARAEIVGQQIVDEVVAIESEENLPITATLTWL